MSVEYSSFPCEELEKMHPGIVYASVPVFEGRVQINNQRGINKTLLCVTKDEFSVSISRYDSRPLEVEINEREAYSPSEPNLFRLFQRQVFAEPLQKATFTRTSTLEGEAEWHLLEEPNSPFTEHLQTLGHRIGSYAVLKQKKLAHQEDGPPALILHPLRGGTYGQTA